METRSFDNDFLLAYSAEHVYYEVDMFFGMAEILSPKNKIGASTKEELIRLNSALVESFIIHLRNIIDFLYNDTPRPTDVVATDFCANWKTIRPLSSLILVEAKNRADKELAHLTILRIAGISSIKQWNFSELTDEIRPILRLFVKNTKANVLSPEISKAIR